MRQTEQKKPDRQTALLSFKHALPVNGGSLISLWSFSSLIRFRPRNLQPGGSPTSGLGPAPTLATVRPLGTTWAGLQRSGQSASSTCHELTRPLPNPHIDIPVCSGFVRAEGIFLSLLFVSCRGMGRDDVSLIFTADTSS